MAFQSVTLKLPDDLYTCIQEVAHASQRSVDDVLVESLEMLFREQPLPADTDALLAEMPTYSDVQLWAVVYRRLPPAYTTRLRELVTWGKQGVLSPEYEAEMEHLTMLVDQAMLLRSEALLLLQQRGYDIGAYLKAGA